MSNVFLNAFLGTLVGDALAMPVHWYYDTSAMDRDYGPVNSYFSPRNPHPDSILWRSHYKAANELGEILHDQSEFWGRIGIHYHQFLKAGENTLNYQLAIELYSWILRRGGYHPEEWLNRYIEVMRMPKWHNDTYVEEVHRGFFTNYANGRKPEKCAVHDLHIGSLSHVAALIAGLNLVANPSASELEASVADHVSKTHNHTESIQAARLLVRLLCSLNIGVPLRQCIAQHAGRWIGVRQLEIWEKLEDRIVIGQKVSSSCYLPEALTASLYLVWKYADDFDAGIQANAEAGGDNCHRAAVVGSLLGGAQGVPKRWLNGLKVNRSLFSRSTIR